MSFLYGFRASAKTRIDCSLIRPHAALTVQSEAESVGNARGDGGWGMVLYDSGLLTVERHAAGAFDDPNVSTAARQAYAKTALLHARSATVGALSIANSHPFLRRSWSFAHQGTVTAFDQVAPQLFQEMQPSLLADRKGSTDSELVFLWLLGRMARLGIDPDAPSGDLDRLTRVVGSSVRYLSALSHFRGAPSPAKLGLLLTDGNVMIATRWKTSLYWTERDRIEACAICGRSHVRRDDGNDDYRAVLVASRPITKECWREVPEASVLAIDRDLAVEIQPI